MAEKITTHPNLSRTGYEKHIIEQGEHEGFPFIIADNAIGYRCGYVNVPANHPWAEKDYDSITATVHGGLTFCERGTDGSWWVGFDCAHSGDAPDPAIAPASVMRSRAMRDYETIKGTDFVRNECRDLCDQASAISKATA